ncbi:MAG: aromatic amino acid transport family protein [Gammaproteobacteria bacterium]
MLNSDFSKFIGSIFILVGTTVGAGMLALPIVSAAVGFAFATIILTIVFSFMLITALLTLEVSLAFDIYRNHFSTMADATLGRFGQILAWIICLLLLNALIAAYIVGNGSLLTTSFLKLTGTNMPDWFSLAVITIIFGSIVCYGTHLVSWCEKGLLSVKGILLIITFSVLMPHVRLKHLFDHYYTVKYMWSAIPIFIVCFGFHPTIPSIINYIGKKPRELKWIIIYSALVPLIIYLLWLIVVFGIIPLLGKHGFIHFAAKKNSIVYMLDEISFLLKNNWLTVIVNGFSDIAMSTAFLGVSLGLFDFLADALKRKNNFFGRLQTGILTFVPPLCFVLFYPKGFVYVLSYAAFFAIILVIIMPAMMTYKLRKSKKLHSSFRVIGGNSLLCAVILFALFVMAIECLFVFHLLPIFGLS